MENSPPCMDGHLSKHYPADVPRRRFFGYLAYTFAHIGINCYIGAIIGIYTPSGPAKAVG
jgi:hypothetical protein